MASRAFAIRRITKDLKEFEANPIEGVGLCLLNDKDLFQMLLNIEIQQGRYKGLIVHIMFFLPENYPCKAPRMLIMPGQCYDNSFHHHIYPDCSGYFRFCIDLLDEAIMDSSAQGSGWSPGYTFCTLFMQMQNFLADPDFHYASQHLSDEALNLIREKMSIYSFSHEVNGKTVTHHNSNPFPALARMSEQKKNLAIATESIEWIVGERLQCFMTKESIFSNPNEVFGYPILTTTDKFNRLNQIPVTEIISSSAFVCQVNSNIGRSFKSGMGETYNAFLPIYLNEKHFNQALKEIKLSLGKISSSPNFEGQVINVLPNLINKLLVALLKGETHVSVAAIEAYVHFTQLFHRLVEELPALKKDIETKVTNFIKGDHFRNKKECGDIGEFIIILSASRYARSKELMDLLFREIFSRNILWASRSGEISAFKKLPEGPQRLSVVFKSGLIGSKLLMFNIEAARRFIDDSSVLKNLAETSYSVLPSDQAEKFVKDTMKVVESVQTHSQLMEYIGLGDYYPTQGACYQLFKQSIHLSNKQGYTKVDIHLQNYPRVTAEDLNLGPYQPYNLQPNQLVVKGSIAVQKVVDVQKPAVSAIVSKVDDDSWFTVSTNKSKGQSQNQEIVQPATAVVAPKKSLKLPAKLKKEEVKEVEQRVVEKSASEVDEWTVIPDKKR